MRLTATGSAARTQGDLAPVVTEFAGHLTVLGHTRLTVTGYDAAARHLAQWLTLATIAVADIDDGVTDRLARHRCRCPGIRREKGVSEKHVRRVRRFVEFLGERGIVRRKPKLAFPTLDRRLVEFQDWLQQHRGVTELTIGRHGRMVMRLLPALGIRSRSWNAQLIRDLIIAETKRVSLAYVKTMTMALRGYFRFLSVPSGTRSGCANHSAVAIAVAAAIHPLVRCRDVDCNVRSDHGDWRA
ncbi:hypothetical protein [Bradyrhizobium sp. 166]|uniref:hypothetical protein n=1 Tax=Bradyrhizobium sp. 166 TaxID=2782638 RepID=UPI001FFBBC6F|nr:hypothetical protein [Bradyrhizobium sp. 166]